MKRILLRSVGVLVLIVAALVIFVWIRSSHALQQTWHIDEAALTLPTDASAIARGQRLAITRGCAECHGDDFAGHVVMEEPPIGRLAAPNLTRGRGSVTAGFSVQDWERTIRHGIKRDGHGELFMPTRDFAGLTDADTADLIAYLMQLPAVDHEQAPSYVGPIGRALFAFGKLPLIEARLIDQRATHATTLTPSASIAYGHYLAQTCTGCHGEHLSGGAVPGVPPSFAKAANITPDPISGIGAWNKADFYRAVREGKKPDGTALDPFMPSKAFSHFDDTEMDALAMYLRSVPARPAGHH